MLTGLERLVRMEALLDKLAASTICEQAGSSLVDEARTLVECRSSVRHAHIMRLFAREIPLMSECGRARLARDVLAALDK